MARVVNKEEYAARRNEILDAARRFVYTKGYEQMTIQDILDDLQISKGAFYHYFNSKCDVLEALVERMVIDEVLPLILPIVEDSELSAIEKLERYFDIALRWKTAQKSFMLAILRVWIADENAIVRQKILTMTLKQVSPLLADIIRQGVDEGVFTTSYPEQVSHLVIHVLLGLSDTMIDLIVASETNPDPVRTENTVSAYIYALRDAIERILGAPCGSLKLIKPEVLNQWFVPSEENRLSPEPNPG